MLILPPPIHSYTRPTSPLNITPPRACVKRLEATYEIREDIADVLARVGSYTDDSDKVRFAGWARMALPMRSFKV